MLLEKQGREREREREREKKEKRKKEKSRRYSDENRVMANAQLDFRSTFYNPGYAYLQPLHCNQTTLYTLLYNKKPRILLIQTLLLSYIILVSSAIELRVNSRRLLHVINGRRGVYNSWFDAIFFINGIFLDTCSLSLI